MCDTQADGLIINKIFILYMYADKDPSYCYCK